MIETGLSDFCLKNLHLKNFKGITSKKLFWRSSNWFPVCPPQIPYFNVEIDKPYMKSFCETYNLANLIKQPTCYKTSDNPTYIDLILTNVPRTFQNTCVIETGLLDFHLMTLTIMRKTFKKQRPRIINYRSFKHFSNEEFRKSLVDSLSNQISINKNDGFNRFCKTSIDTLNDFAPIKKNCWSQSNAFYTKTFL